MYHINHEGKVYPCKARINKCPYGDSRHAKTKEELFYRLMKVARDALPSTPAMEEMGRTGRLRSLWSASDDIANSKAPVETVVATLDVAIKALLDTSPEEVSKRYDPIRRKGAEAVYEALKYGLLIPKIVPKDIRDEGHILFYKRLKGVPVEFAGSTRNKFGLDKRRYLLEMKDEFEMYEEYKKWGLTKENYDNTLGWLKQEFYRFSHDLNTSKMITQPVFYGDINKARETIKEMQDFELLAAYDDYLLSDREVLENIALANNFDYESRRDLSHQANDRLAVWYNMNKAIVEDWKKNAPKRILLSIEMANELDRRNIRRQDNALGRIKK